MPHGGLHSSGSTPDVVEGVGVHGQFKDDSVNNPSNLGVRKVQVHQGRSCPLDFLDQPLPIAPGLWKREPFMGPRKLDTLGAFPLGGTQHQGLHNDGG